MTRQKLNTNSSDKHCQLSHFYKLDVSYAIQHTFSKVTRHFYVKVIEKNARQLML